MVVRTDVKDTESSWVPTDEGRHLRGRKTRNTKPEIRLRSAVHRLGLRFRLHVSVAKGCTPDFVLPRWRTAVFVDGCFWHGCPRHSPQTFRGPNAKLWEDKLAANRERDRRTSRLAEAEGWRVLRVWECEVKADVVSAAERVRVAAGAPAASYSSV